MAWPYMVGSKNKTESEIMIENDPYNPSDDPTVSIRADLWNTMNISELANQQDLVLNKISLMTSMMGGVPPQSYRDMRGALETALADLNALIERQMNQKPQ